MLDMFFRGLFDTALTDTIAPTDFLLCIGVSLALGLLLCGMTVWRSQFSRSLIITLAILPAIVCVVILMVNGNVGTGVAVAGAFNLVRFRSAPGSAREIGALFVAMGTGLITGMGYLGYGALFTFILGAAMMLYNAVHLRLGADAPTERTLHITIPEDLDYAGVFDPVLTQYTRRHSLTQVKTTNMGSLFKLTYDVTLKDPSQEKHFIDQLRLRNGNLEITLGHQDSVSATL
nr:DUF4956 domain-containing protein [uncultured Agathobaculum sp.]